MELFLVVAAVAFVLLALSPLRVADGDPAGAPTAPAAPATPAPAVPAAPATPVATPAPQPAPAPSADPLTMETPLEYVGADGKPATATVAELIESHSKLAGMGDVQAAQDMQAALNNDPEAMKRLLSTQLTKLEAETAPKTEPNADIAELRAEVADLRTKVARTEPIVESVETGQTRTQVAAMLERPEVAKAYPWLAAKPDVGVPTITADLLDLQKKAKAIGVDISARTDLVQGVLERANRKVEIIATQFGGGLPAPTNGQPAAGAVVGVTGAPEVPSADHGGLAVAPRVTAADLLQQSAGAPAPPAPPAPGTVLPTQVPEAGGQTGGITGGPVQGAGQPKRYDAAGLRARIASQRAATTPTE